MVRITRVWWRILLVQQVWFAVVVAKLADRSRVVQSRGSHRDHGHAIAGPRYKVDASSSDSSVRSSRSSAPWKRVLEQRDVDLQREPPQDRQLSSQLSGCCYNYQKYSASKLCYMYGNDCESGETPSHDDGDGDCSQDGLSFIGISFSVNTANGNPYSYQLNDQFPMENIIDRDYEYVMSLDEDGWLVGGGYKTFDYSGKMP